MEPGHLLHSALTHPSSANARRLKSRHPFVLAAVHLTTTTTYVRHTGPITNGMRCGWTTLQDSAFSSPTPAPIPPEQPSQKEPGPSLTASEPVSGVSTPACTNGVWPALRPVSVAQQNKPSTILSSSVQPTNLLMDCTYGLAVLDHETIEWLLNTCPEISCGQAVDRTTGSKEEESIHIIFCWSPLKSGWDDYFRLANNPARIL